MEAESFFARWSKRNAEAAAEKRESEASAAVSVVANQEHVASVKTPPTLEDVSLLTADSDFTRFVARGVDETVRRSAMKKLFADPRFNVMDGLDVYIEDYHTFTPIPAAMLAALNHAKSLLDPLAQAESSLMKVLEDEPEDAASAASAAHNSDAVSEGKQDEPDGPPAEDQTNHDDPVQGM